MEISEVYYSNTDEIPLKLCEYNAAKKASPPFFNTHISMQIIGASDCVDTVVKNPINSLPKLTPASRLFDLGQKQYPAY